MKRKNAITPPCSFCGQPSFPIGKKRYEELKKIVFCSDPCQEKWPLFKEYKDKLNKVSLSIDDTTVYLDILNLAVKLNHTADKISKEHTVMLFSQSVYTFGLTETEKTLYEVLLRNKSKELLHNLENMVKIDYADNSI